MKSLSQHLTGPGFVAVEVTAADEPTAVAAAQAISTLWWSSGPSAPCRVPGEDGVRVRLYADVRRAPDGQEPDRPRARNHSTPPYASHYGAHGRDQRDVR